jgi:hypothetical protein
VRIKSMSPFFGVIFCSFKMLRKVENEIECVENVEYSIGGVCFAAQLA